MSSVIRWVVLTLAAFCVINMIFFLMLLEEKSQTSLLNEKLESISHEVQASRQRIVSDVASEVAKIAASQKKDDGAIETPQSQPEGAQPEQEGTPCANAGPKASETLAKWLLEAKDTVRMRRGIGQIRVIDRLEEIEMALQNKSEVYGAPELEPTLAEYILYRLHFQQHDMSCTADPVLHCDLQKACGFGCQLHHLADCLLVATHTGRTLMLQDKPWSYDGGENDDVKHTGTGWEYFFMRLSKVCENRKWDGGKYLDDQNARDIYTMNPKLQIIDGRSVLRWAIYFVPKYLEPLIKSFHKNPPAWYLGQFERYLLRPNRELVEHMRDVRKEIQFSHPCAGMHIRRTDKLHAEAQYHDAAEYVDPSVEWFKRLKSEPNLVSKPVVAAKAWASVRKQEEEAGFLWKWHNESTIQAPDKRPTIFVVTDDAAEPEKMVKRYPDLRVLTNQRSNELGSTSRRNSRASLMNLMTDVYLLAECEYFVGTFSSQIGRLAYELMQTYFIQDWSPPSRVNSLDDMWYYSG